MLLNIDVHIWVVLLQVPLKVSEAHLVTVFKLSKDFILLLDGVVGEVHELVTQTVEVKNPAACSQVSIFIEVAFQLFVDACQQGKNSKIKFSFMDQQWPIYVLLDDVRLVLIRGYD